MPVRTGSDRPPLAALLSELEMFLGYSQHHIPTVFLTFINLSSLKFYPSRSLLSTFLARSVLLEQDLAPAIWCRIH